jgi:hypothetical protein
MAYSTRQLLLLANNDTFIAKYSPFLLLENSPTIWQHHQQSAQFLN